MIAALDIDRDALTTLLESAKAQLASFVGTDPHTEAARAAIRARLHAKQAEVLDMVRGKGSRFIACECGRRAGKTTLAASAIVDALLVATRGQEVVFCAPTLARGKELIWHTLEEMIDEYGLSTTWRVNMASGKIRTPAGAMFRIVGLDNRRQVGKVSRGGNTILFVTDETQEFPHLLEMLLVAASPALVQTRGCFLALGTPTVNEADYWAQICDGAEGFRHVHWSLRDNPFLGRDPEDVLREERDRHGWDESHPTYVREYLGRRCRDASMMLLEISRAKNTVGSIAGYDPTSRQWRHFIGIDFGLGDRSAWVVLAAKAGSRDVFTVHCEAENGLDWDQVAERTKQLVERFPPQGIAGDSASGGAQFIATFNKRYGRLFGVVARSATKHDKPASIAVMNTELRTGRLRMLLPACDQLYCESSALQWKDKSRKEVLEGDSYPEDLFDAFRYAFNDFYAWAYPAGEREMTAHEREVEEANRREAARHGFNRRRVA